MESPNIGVSIIIPARNALATLGRTIESVLVEHSIENVEIIVVNDGMDEDTVRIANIYPVKVINGNGQGPAAARNIGVKNAKGKILIFLDADCRVSPGWLSTHLSIHEFYSGLLVVGGSICMEPGAPFWARIDHYCSWYNVNPGLPASWVPNHPAANMSVSRLTFDRIGSFKADLPRVGVHEEIDWHKRLLRSGGRIRFEPRAFVWHKDRDDLRSLLSHNYRWGYNSIQVKSGSSVSRFPLLYRCQWILIWGFLPFAFAFTLYTVLCWLRVGKLEPVLFCPLILLGRLAYATGMAIGGQRALFHRSIDVVR